MASVAELTLFARESYRVDTLRGFVRREAGGCHILSVDQEILVKSAAETGKYFCPVQSAIKCFACGITTPHLDLNHEPSCWYPELVRVQKKQKVNGKSHYGGNFESCSVFNYEAQRLLTFIDWTVPWVSPLLLAERGYFYLRVDDHCSCFSCGITLALWDTAGCDSLTLGHHPQCRVLNNSAADISLAASDILQQCLTDPDRDTIPYHETTDVAEKKPRSKKYIQHQYKPEYCTLEERRKSFYAYGRGWTWDRHISPSHERWARAGFFFRGFSDAVVCFSCLITIRNIRYTDEPTNQHADDCYYAHVNRYPNRNRVKPTAKKFKSLREKELAAFCSHYNPYRYVIELGYSEAAAKKALNKRLRKCGVPFMSWEAFADNVIEGNAVGDDKRYYYDLKKDKVDIEPPKKLCLSCNKSPVAVSFYPCQHSVSCDQCLFLYRSCPLCSKNISRCAPHTTSDNQITDLLYQP